jgi:Ni,Fe-hydrogenase maturation factor
VLELAELIPAGQLDAGMLVDLPRGGSCVVVDAVAGIPPGSIWRRPLADLQSAGTRRAGPGSAGARRAGPAPRSSHLMPVEQVLELAAILRDEPVRGTFVGIGGVEFGLGASLSPAVMTGIPGLVQAIAAEVVRLADGDASSSAKMSASRGATAGIAPGA